MKNRIIFLLLTFCPLQLFSQWRDLQTGVNSAVYSFFVDSASNKLFVGGLFNSAGGSLINNIAVWDSLNWSSFGNNAPFSSPGGVYSILKYNGRIIVGGDFDSIGSVKVNNIAQWNGIDWEPLGSGFNNAVEDLIIYNNELYACGTFSYSDTNDVRCVAKWDGNHWSRISNLMGYAITFAIFDGKLIIGGSFFHNTLHTVQNIVGWDGLSTDTSFGSFNNTVIKLKSINDTLYATGKFTSISVNTSNYISLYYNQSWHSIGSPTGGSNWIIDVIKYQNELYLCGYFTNPPDICKFNGTGFDSVAEALGHVQFFTEYKGELYIGGAFIQLDGMNMQNISRYYKSFTSTEDNIAKSDRSLFIFPNPCPNETINAKIISTPYRYIVKVELININGETVHSRNFSDNCTRTIKIDLPFIKGVYFLKCTYNDGNIEINKIIKI
jgi:hypothetical protein